MISSFRFVGDSVLAGCRMPWSTIEIDWLMSLGIQAVISLEPLDQDLCKYMAEKGLDHLNIFVPDGEEPTMEQVTEFLDFVARQKKLDKKVLVHCLAGRGRTGTFLAVYLIAQGKTADQAMNFAGWPDTEDQIRFVYDFAAKFSQK